jgi:hypothetical protein
VSFAEGWWSSGMQISLGLSMRLMIVNNYILPNVGVYMSKAFSCMAQDFSETDIHKE